jgi:hypothetical protein
VGGDFACHPAPPAAPHSKEVPRHARRGAAVNVLHTSRISHALAVRRLLPWIPAIRAASCSVRFAGFLRHSHWLWGERRPHPGATQAHLGSPHLIHRRGLVKLTQTKPEQTRNYYPFLTRKIFSSPVT